MASQSVFHRCEIVKRGRRHDVRVDSSNSQFRSRDSSLGIKTWNGRAKGGTAESREGEAPRRFVAGALREDRRRCGARKESGQNQSRRIAAELLLDIRRRQPVRVEAESAPHDPTASRGYIPRDSGPRIVGLRTVCQGIFSRLCESGGHLLLQGRTTPEIEVAEYRGIRSRIRVALVIEPESEIDRDIAASLPRVFGKNPPGLRGSVPVPELLLAGDGVVHHTAFAGRRILGERQQIVEAEAWMGPRPLERFHVVAEPPLIANLDDVSATHIGQHIPPMVVVLDKIALREAHAVANGLSGHADSGNGEVARLSELPLDTVLAEDCLV